MHIMSCQNQYTDKHIWTFVSKEHNPIVNSQSIPLTKCIHLVLCLLSVITKHWYQKFTILFSGRKFPTIQLSRLEFVPEAKFYHTLTKLKRLLASPSKNTSCGIIIEYQTWCSWNKKKHGCTFIWIHYLMPLSAVENNDFLSGFRFSNFSVFDGCEGRNDFVKQ